MQSPFLVADVSAYYARPNWSALLAHPNFIGVILKATEGTTYAPHWFADNWKLVRELAGSRYGDTWFRSAYHFLRRGDGAAQADFFVDTIQRAGGFGPGDMMCAVDIEGADWTDAAELVATARAFAARFKARTGRKLLRYARGVMRDLGVKDDLGCDGDWDASYTREIVTNGLASLAGVVLWQYRGMNGRGEIEGDNSVHGLPMTVAGFEGPADFSVVVDGGHKVTLESARARLGVVNRVAQMIAAGVLLLAAFFAARAF